MKTLYVSDLDGTLLRSDQRTSEYTNRTVNALVARGMCFSYATARSYMTAGKVTAGMDEAFPVILYNGAFVRDNRTGELLIRNFFGKDEAARLVRELQESGISPIVYAFVDGEEKFSYDRNTVNAATREFIQEGRQPGPAGIRSGGRDGRGDLLHHLHRRAGEAETLP